MNKLLMCLHPDGRNFTEFLSKRHMPVYPYFSLVSRLNYKPDAFDHKLLCKTLSEIMQLPKHNDSFAQCADRRAIELLNVPGNIYVLWSGGIDSTVVLTAILRNWPSEDLKRITVLCNKDSINENRNFFTTVAKNFKIATSSADFEQYCKLGHVITGELGDQLFGHDLVGKCEEVAGEGAIQADWKVMAPKVLKSLFGDQGINFYETYRPIATEAPFELKSAHEFFWFLNFTQKWQHVQLRSLMSNTWTDPKKYFKKVLHFFDTEYFQIWSIHNQGAKIKTTWHSYKYSAKEYVVDYTKDESFHNKLKLPSMTNLYVCSTFYWSIDEDWNYLNKEETMMRLLKD